MFGLVFPPTLPALLTGIIDGPPVPILIFRLTGAAVMGVRCRWGLTIQNAEDGPNACQFDAFLPCFDKSHVIPVTGDPHVNQ